MRAEQRDRAGKRDAGGPAPRTQGWGVRAEQAYGELSSDPSWTLSASEIGVYAFCPQAWFLQRCRLPVTAETEARRQAGSRTHRAIGWQTDLVPAAGFEMQRTGRPWSCATLRRPGSSTTVPW